MYDGILKSPQRGFIVEGLLRQVLAMDAEQLKSLVSRAQNGDLDAYAQLVRRFQDMAYGYGYAVLGDFHLAEDAAQEAFIQAYRDLGSLTNPAAFGGWFRRIVFKHCNRITRRKQVRTTPLNAAVSTSANGLTPPEEMDKRQMQETVLAAIRALPEKQRTTTTLFYINGYSQNDIAEFLEVPVTTVKKRLHDARTRLKERMIDMVEDEFKKHALPKEFTQRVVTLAEIVKEGKSKYFEFANGVSIRTRVDKVIQDDVQLHLLICGPTTVTCHSDQKYPSSFDSFVVVPSMLATVTEVDKNVGDASRKVEHPPAFEIIGTVGAKHDDKAEYTALATASGSFEVAPNGGFGFVRTGKDRCSYEYFDRKGQEHTWQASPQDIYVSDSLMQKHHLKDGDTVTCTWRHGVGNERYRSAVDVLDVTKT